MANRRGKSGRSVKDWILTACIYVNYFKREERGALFIILTVHLILANGLVIKNPPANAGDLGLILGLSIIPRLWNIKKKKSLKSNSRKNLVITKQAEQGSFRSYRNENGKAHRTGKPKPQLLYNFCLPARTLKSQLLSQLLQAYTRKRGGLCYPFHVFSSSPFNFKFNPCLFPTPSPIL